MSVAFTLTGQGNGAGSFLSTTGNTLADDIAVVSIREAFGQAGGSTPTHNAGGGPGSNFAQIGTTQPDTTNSVQLRTYWAKVPAKTGFQVTVNYSSSADSSYSVTILRGRDPTSPLIASSLAQAGDGFSPWSVTSGALEANADVLGFCADNQGVQTYSVDAPFNLESQEGNGSSYWTGCVASAVAPSTAAMSPSFTSTVGGQAAVVVVAFREAAGGGPVDTPINPAPGALAITGPAPSLLLNRTIAPAPGALTVTGPSPTLALGKVIAPAPGQVTVTGPTPTVARGLIVAPAAGQLAITGPAPTIAVSVTPGDVVIAPAPALLTVTGPAPTITQSGAPAPSTGGKGFEMGGRRIAERNFKPLLQRVLERRYPRVKPAKERAARRAKAIEQTAAQLVADDPQDLARFDVLMRQWMAERPVAPPGLDLSALFEAQVGFRLRQLQLEQQARDALAAAQARDEEDALALLLLLS